MIIFSEARDILVNREVRTAAMVFETLDRPGAEHRHVVVLRAALHCLKVERKDRL